MPWKSKLAYHWSELWHAMIGLTKFVIAHAEELKEKPGFDELIELVNSFSFFEGRSG